MMIRHLLIPFFGLMTVSWKASAHPGHGLADGPASHYLLNPDRLGALLVVAVTLCFVVRALRCLKCPGFERP